MVKIQELYDVIFNTAFEGFRVRHQKQTSLERIYFKESPIAHGQMTIDFEVKYNTLNQKKLLEDLMCLDNFQLVYTNT